MTTAFVSCLATTRQDWTVPWVLASEVECPFLRSFYHQWYLRLSEDDSLGAGALGGAQSLLFLGDKLSGPAPREGSVILVDPLT